MATVTFTRTNLRHGRKRGVSPKADWNELVTLVNKLVTLTQELKTDLSAHVHGGITAGAANTSAALTISAADPDTMAID